MSVPGTDAIRDVAEIHRALVEDLARLEGETAEIQLLVAQVRAETERHEGRRVKGEERVSALESQPRPGSADLDEARAQLLMLTRRAAMMDTQLQVLEGKQRTLQRYRDHLARLLADLASSRNASAEAAGGNMAGADVAIAGAAPDPGKQGDDVARTRAVLRAQEAMRRDIARQMHDGPAQSIANIALQAEIVQRLLARDPKLAAGEVEQLRGMVQRALDATKSFIFDVRPMVLDDLGLVPTLRRATIDRGKRGNVLIDFDSVGTDRRLPPDLESGFFRIIDEALTGFLSLHPSQLIVRLDWAEREVQATVRSGRADERAVMTRAAADLQAASLPADDMPPALAEMIQQQRADEFQQRSQAHALPPAHWQEIQARAMALGVTVRLVDDGQTLEAVAPGVP